MLNTALSLEDQCAEIWRLTREQKFEQERLRRDPPVVRLWDAEWQLQHVVSGIEYQASFQWISNDTGPGQISLPFDHPAAAWVHDSQGRIDRGEGRNVHLTVDFCGTRWSGRLDKAVVETGEDGDDVLVMDFAHDYENLKFYSVWSNPFLPAAFQFPRAWLLAGPVRWVLLTTLHLQLIREHNPLITIPDDPLDFASYLEVFDQSTWQVVVKPLSFLEDAASGVVWGVASSRWATWHDMAKIMLEDSELSVVCTRYLEGDPLPWDGANLRHGTLVISIEDKSGVYIGTANGGSIFDGLVRTVAEFADDFIDSTQNLISDTEAPEDYFLPGFYATNKEFPYVVYRTGEGSGIQTSRFINSPAKAVQVNVGGHSMPGVNEAISASIQAAGDIIGNIFLIGSLGGSIDTLLRPLYEDTILAWWSVKSTQRAQNSGWSRYFEYFQDGANKAYTIAALMVLRAGFWATKTVIANEMQVVDASPYLIAPPPLGHFFLDDRIGFALENDPTGQVWMDRARKIELKWDAETFPEWVPTIGDPRNLQDPAQRAWGKLEQMLASLRDLGVWSIAAVGISAAAVLALNFSPDEAARPTHTASIRTDIGVISSELMSTQAVGLPNVSVSSAPDLVTGVITLGSPRQVF